MRAMSPRLSLSLIAAPDAVRPETREVEGYEFTLGRGSDVDWCLLDPDRNILSRHHCVLRREDDGWWIEDRSGNGTFLNQNPSPIGSGGKKPLRDGDRFRMGPYEFQVAFQGAFPGASASPFQADAAGGRAGDFGTGAGVSQGLRSPFGDDPEPEPSSSQGTRPGAGGSPFGDDPAPGWPPSGWPAADPAPADDAWPPRPSPRSAPQPAPRAEPAPAARSSPFTDDTDPAAAETGEPSQWRPPPPAADPWPPAAAVTMRDPNPPPPLTSPQPVASPAAAPQPAGPSAVAGSQPPTAFGADSPANPFARPGEPNSARIKAPVVPPAPPRPAAAVPDARATDPNAPGGAAPAAGPAGPTAGMPAGARRVHRAISWSPSCSPPPACPMRVRTMPNR